MNNQEHVWKNCQMTKALKLMLRFHEKNCAACFLTWKMTGNGMNKRSENWQWVISVPNLQIWVHLIQAHLLTPLGALDSEEKFISVQTATVHQIHFRQEIKLKIESGQITLNMKPFQPEVGAITCKNRPLL